MISTIYEAVNWNSQDNAYVLSFWEQNLRQFWIDTEYIPSKDIDDWNSLDKNTKQTYLEALAGLTLLDTFQSNISMQKIIDHIPSLQCKAVLSYMSMMETVHAKSYSTIFTTVASVSEIDDIFLWVKQSKELQFKASTVDFYYEKLRNMNVSQKDVYMALSASVLLESFLFYSGFFVPLWLTAQGKMTASCDIIKKIIADESIHGIFIGVLAQEIYNNFDKQEQEDVYADLEKLFNTLYNNELAYSKELYTKIGKAEEVEEYIKYNANKAFQNLGFEEIFIGVEINPMVQNGLNTESTQHDFFSKKSTNYEKVIAVEYLTDEDFHFEIDTINVNTRGFNII